MGVSTAHRGLWVPALLVALSLTVGAPAGAGFEEGKRAAMEGDYEAAYREWQPLAEAGHVEAQFLLGLMHREGRGVPQDLVTAVSWLRRAAAQGHVDAEYFLARAYRLGQGVERDPREALRWLFRAAAQHHADAAHMIALMYRKGEGIAPDDELAVEWYRIAARLGHGEARFTLGSAYEEGRGVEKDWVRAYAWYSLAGKSGVELGGVLRDRLRRQLSAAEVAAAETLMVEIASAPPPALPSTFEAIAAARPGEASPPTTTDPKVAGRVDDEPPLAPSPSPSPSEAALRAAEPGGGFAAEVASSPPAPGGEYYVRLASYRLADEPLRGWQVLIRSNGDLLGSLSPVVREVDLGGEMGKFYRLYAGSLADRSAARTLCAALRSRHAECIVDRP